MTATTTSPSAPSSFALWRDNRGRLSVLRIATLALMAWPIVLAVVAWQTEIRFEARPVNDLIHRVGFFKDIHQPDQFISQYSRHLEVLSSATAPRI